MEKELLNDANNQEIIEFPHALFTRQEKRMLKEAELSEEEQKLFQLLMWYGHECDSYIYSYREIFKPYNIRNIPYEYLKEEGFDQTVKRIEILKSKLPEEMIMIVYDFIKTNPGKLFSVKNMTPSDFILCKSIFVFQKYREIQINKVENSIKQIRDVEKNYEIVKDRYFSDNPDDLPPLEIVIGWIKADSESETLEVTEKGKEIVRWMDKYFENWY